MYDLLDRERKKLVGYVRSLLRETADMDAEDLVQDVLLRFLERPGSSGTIENSTAYIYSSLRNRVIDYRRKRKPIQHSDSAESPGGENLIDLLQDHRPNAIDQLQTLQGKQELFEALECLNEIEKQVVIAYELEGIPFKVLAEEWTMPQNTLLSHKSRAMKKLKNYFSKEKESTHEQE